MSSSRFFPICIAGAIVYSVDVLSTIIMIAVIAINGVRQPPNLVSSYAILIYGSMAIRFAVSIALATFSAFLAMRTRNGAVVKQVYYIDWMVGTAMGMTINILAISIFFRAGSDVKGDANTIQVLFFLFDMLCALSAFVYGTVSAVFVVIEYRIRRISLSFFHPNSTDTGKYRKIAMSKTEANKTPGGSSKTKEVKTPVGSSKTKAVKTTVGSSKTKADKTPVGSEGQ